MDPHAGSVTNTPGAFEVTWNVGDLRPGERSHDLEMTVVPGLGAPDEIAVSMIGRSTNHRGNTTDTATLTVSSEEWTVDDWFVADRDT